ncbi:MAG: hypothetical protein C0483_11345 [Pirellula sp.]|nr:hypothetical protein [Pirellula sp.]
MAVEVHKANALISIRSPVGISDAVIERSSEPWSEHLVLRLHLKGLENLRISNGKVTLDAAVSSQDDDMNRVRLWRDGKEDSPLDATSPCWMEISLVGRDGKSTKEIPLNDGYFEMKLPRPIFEGNPKSITVSWIDFYRT